MITFIHDSDLHYNKNSSRKKNNVKKILNISPDFVIVTGDLTDNGYDGSNFLCFNYGGDEDQLTPLKQKYVNVLDYNDIPVYLCDGNHDNGRNKIPYKPVLNYIKKRHGGLNYIFEYNGVYFICCSVYPKNIKWLKKKLNKTKYYPVFIYFHYNLKDKYSDWWSDKAKQKFYNTIKDYKNIKALLEGHFHNTKVYYWNEFLVIRSSGRHFGIIQFDLNKKEIINISHNI